MELKTLNEEFDGWLLGNGLFANMPSTVPWKDSVDAAHLDALYFGARSGSKASTPIVSLQAHDDTGALTQNSRMAVASYLNSMFSKNWAALWATLSLDYNPIHNYNMEETISDNGTSTRTPNLNTTSSEVRTPNLSQTSESLESPNTTDTTDVTRTPNITKTETGTLGIDITRTPDITKTETGTLGTDITRTPNLSKTETGTVVTENQQSGDGQDNFFGFNSVSSVPANSSATTANGNQTDTFNKQYGESGIETTSQTDTVNKQYGESGTETSSQADTFDKQYGESGTENTKQTLRKTGSVKTTKSADTVGTDTSERTETESGSEQTVKSNSQTTKKSGNIGVTTTQKMISEERELWFWNFFNQVFSDIDGIIAVKTYM